MATSPGWHRDPSGRFEFRYHNGERWTNDVSSGGVRYVDRAAPERPKATTGALVFGLVGLGLAWLPMLFVVGFGFGITAVVLATRARRTVTDPGVDRMLTAGLATGVGAIALSAVGIWFTVVLYRAVDRYQTPAANEATITQCTSDGDTTRASGTITNTSDGQATFTVRVDLAGERATYESGSLDPGESETFSVQRRSQTSDDRCRVIRVDGPLPLGIDLD